MPDDIQLNTDTVPAPVEPPQPPKWSEVVAHPEFETFSPAKRLVVFDRWQQDAGSHAAANGVGDEFNKKASELQAQLSKDAGVDSIDKARVQVASEAIANRMQSAQPALPASPDGVAPELTPLNPDAGNLELPVAEAAVPTGPVSLTPQEMRDTLKPLGKDVYTAFIKEHGIPKPGEKEWEGNLEPAPVETISAAPTITGELAKGNLKEAAGMAYENIRENLEPIFGPTVEGASKRAIAWGKNADGTTHYEYKPLGDGVEKNGLIPSIADFIFTNSAPIAALQRQGIIPEEALHYKINPDDSTTKQLAKGTINAGNDLMATLLSPLTFMALGGTGKASKLVSGGFSLDMLSKVAPQWKAAQSADNPQDYIQNILGVATSLGMGLLAGKHAVTKGPLPAATIADHVDTVADHLLQIAGGDSGFAKSAPEIHTAVMAELEKRGLQPKTPEQVFAERTPEDKAKEAATQHVDEATAVANEHAAEGIPQTAQAEVEVAKAEADRAVNDVVAAPAVEPAAAEATPAADTRPSFERIAEAQKELAAAKHDGDPVAEQAANDKINAIAKELIGEQTAARDKAQAEVVANPEINPNREVTDETVLHPGDTEMAKKAADALGLRYDGVQGDGAINITNEGTGDTYTMAQGETFTDLKNRIAEKAANRERIAAETAVPESGVDYKVDEPGRELIKGLAQAQKEAFGFGPGAAHSGEFAHGYALLGADKYLEGSTKFSDWSKAFQSEFDEGTFTPKQVRDVWNDMHGLLKDYTEAQVPAAKISVKKQVAESTGLSDSIGNLRYQMDKSVTRAQAFAEYLRGQQKGSKIGSDSMKNQLRLADKWLAADQEKVRQTLSEIINKSLPPAERGRFLGAVTRALRRPDLVRGDPSSMYRNAYKVMQIVQARAEQVYKTSLIENIKTTFNKFADSPSVDVGYRGRIKAVMDTFSLTKPTKATIKRLESLRDHVNSEIAAGRDPEVPKYVIDKLDTLSKLPLKDMPVNALEQLHEDITRLGELGKLKANLMEAAWEAEKRKALEALDKSEATPLNERSIEKAAPTESLTRTQRFWNSINRGENRWQTGELVISPTDQILDQLDGSHGTYDGWASRTVKGKLDLANNEATAERLRVKDESDAIVRRNALKKADMETIGIKGTLNMIGRERLEAMGVRKDIIDRIESTPLTKGQQEYYDFTRKVYDRLGNDVQNVAHRLYQMEVNRVDNYVPLMRDWSAWAEREPIEPGTDPSKADVMYDEQATLRQLQHDMDPGRISRTEQGFLKDRVEGATTPVKLNAQEVFERHIADALHFIHSQPALKMLGEIARTSELEAKFGKTGQKFILDLLDTVATQGQVNSMQRWRWLDNLRNKTSAGAIAFRVASNVVHSSQIPLGAYHTGGAGWWSKGMHMALTPEGQRFLQQHAAETYSRSGGEDAQRDAEALSRVGKWGFVVARNIDKYNAQATFLGRYAKEMNKLGVPIEDVLSAPVNPEIQALALRRMRRAIASPLAKDLPQMTSRGKGVGGNVSIARAINQFRNIFLDNWSNVRHDVLRAGVTDMKKVFELFQQGEAGQGVRLFADTSAHRAAAASAILMGIAMETGIKFAGQQGTKAAASGLGGAIGYQGPVSKKEEKPAAEEIKDQFYHHLVNRVPIVGQLTTAAMYGETGVPVLDALWKPVWEIGRATFKPGNTGTKAKHLERAAEAATALAGIPGAGQASELVRPALTKATEAIVKRARGEETQKLEGDQAP